MRKLIILFLIFGICSVFPLYAQRFEVYQGDTINQVDSRNLKQGLWIYFNRDKTAIIQKGEYRNNKKEGIWVKYYPNGKLKSEITYQNNRTDGYAKIYHENGKLAEEGLWKGNKWVGEYKFYHENGMPAYVWNYNEQGKRNGKQKYYYDNGQIRIEGSWDGGKETGVVKEYYEDGSLKSEKSFQDGIVDVATIKEYQPRQVATNSEKISTDPKNEQTSQTVDNNNSNNQTDNSLEVFSGDGFHKTYNKFKKIEREGNFVNGKQVDGKRYVYDNDGTLIKTIVLENGRVKNVIRHSVNE